MPLYPGRCPGLRASALSGRAAYRKLYLRPMTIGSGRATSGASDLYLRSVTVDSGRAASVSF